MLIYGGNGGSRRGDFETLQKLRIPYILLFTNVFYIFKMPLNKCKEY